MSSSNQPRLTAYDSQPRPGDVNLVEVLYEVPPNRHVEQYQQHAHQVLQPEIQYARQLPHHPMPYPYPQHPPVPQYHPNHPAASHHQPVQAQYQAGWPQDRITQLANEYRAATQFHAANWPPIIHAQSNQLRASGPDIVINQPPATREDEQAECRTLRPQRHIQSGMAPPTQAVLNLLPPIRDTPRHPPGLGLPPTIAHGRVPMLPAPLSNIQGSDIWGRIPLGQSQSVYQPVHLPVPNVFDMQTPKALATSGIGHGYGLHAAKVPESNDSSTEASSDISSNLGTSSSEIERTTPCSSVTSSSEDCTSPPDTATQDTFTPTKAKHSLNDDMEAMVTNYVTIYYNQDGLDALLHEVMRDGTQDHQRSVLNAVAAQLVLRRLERQGIPDMDRFQQALCFEVLRKFREYWNADGEWKTDCLEKSSMLKGVNIAGFVGSLFKVYIVNADDIYACLELLAENSGQLPFACAISALVVHCEARLCTDEHWPRTSQFCSRLQAHKKPVNQDFSDVIRELLGLLARSRATVELQAIRDLADPVKIEKKLHN